MNKVKDRIFYFDEIRALAILLVLLVHTSKWFAVNQTPNTLFWIFPTYLGGIGNLGVQLFIMISGALLLNRQYELKSFFKRRFSRILIPFLFWIFVVIIFRIFILGEPLEISTILNIVLFKGYVWFIWVLMGLYLFIPVINSFIREYGIKGCEFFLVIWFITIILNSIGYYPIENIELRYFSGFLGYMVLGWYLSNKEFRLSDKSLMIAGVLLFIISTLASFYASKHSMSIGTVYKLSIVLVLQATGLYLLIKNSASYSEGNASSMTGRIYSYMKDSWIGKVILSISICSYGMYLTHYLFIWTIIETTNIMSRNPLKWMPVIYLIVVLCSWGLIWICSRIPYLEKVSGA